VFAKIQRIMGGSFEAPPTVHYVRDVSPGKLMLCITFQVPEAVAYNGRQVEQSVRAAGQGALGHANHAHEETGTARQENLSDRSAVADIARESGSDAKRQRM